jgi:hypothetical protein
MKARSLLLLLLPVLCALSLTSCLKDQCEREVTYMQSIPVYMTKSEIRLGSATNEAPRELENPGQFYYYKEHIFIAEQGKGIHIIDNRQPENPQNIAFLAISGADNMAIRNDILYVNNYIDLLVVDISNPHNATVISRTEDAFDPLWEDVNSGQILVEYRLEEVTETLDCDTYSALRWNNGIFWSEAAFSLDAANSTGSNGQVTTGVGGSMARFTIIGEHLYSVSDTELEVFSLESPSNPASVNIIDLGWGIETIFPYEDKLFIGSNSGMFIYDNSNPASPTQLSTFEHARACDPVFVQGDYAYVTLRDGNLCQGFVNQLDLVDISDLTNPRLIESFPMDHPHGLTIRDNHLILCEGSNGIKAFDISTPEVLDEKLLDQYPGTHAWDAISLPGVAPITVIIGEDGFYQFRFDESNGFTLISQIATKG